MLNWLSIDPPVNFDESGALSLAAKLKVDNTSEMSDDESYQFIDFELPQLLISELSELMG